MPLVGLPGNPRSALVVFRLVGVPLVRTVAGVTAPPPAPVVRARLARDVPSAAGRLDVVQVALRDGVADAAVRLVGAARADAAARTARLRAGADTGLARAPRSRWRSTAGERQRVVHRAAMPFLRDVPAAEALAAWLGRSAGWPPLAASSSRSPRRSAA